MQTVGCRLVILQVLHAAFSGQDLDMLLQVGEAVMTWLCCCFVVLPLSCSLLLQHPLNCYFVLFLFRLRFEDVDELVDGVSGHIRWGYDASECFGEIVRCSN